MAADNVIVTVRPSMRSNMMAFFVLIVGIAAAAVAFYFLYERSSLWAGVTAGVLFGLGDLYFLYRLIVVKSIRLDVTPTRTTLTDGIISRNRSEVAHDHVRHTQVRQSLMDRVLGIATLGLDAVGDQEEEILVSGLAIGDVERVKQAIEDNQSKAAPQASQ